MTEIPKNSVADPDPARSEPVCRSRIRSNRPDPDPTKKVIKQRKKSNKLNRYRIFKKKTTFFKYRTKNLNKNKISEYKV